MAKLAVPEPEVKIRAALSPTIRPTPKITPAKIPGIAEGRITRNTVRSRPAPKPKDPSRKESGTDKRASSVVRKMRGKIIMARVMEPASMEKLQ